jgi:hypothetical protein
MAGLEANQAPLMPAKAGIQFFLCLGIWVPAFAGTSAVARMERSGMRDPDFAALHPGYGETNLATLLARNATAACALPRPCGMPSGARAILITLSMPKSSARCVCEQAMERNTASRLSARIMSSGSSALRCGRVERSASSESSVATSGPPWISRRRLHDGERGIRLDGRLAMARSSWPAEGHGGPHEGSGRDG